MKLKNPNKVKKLWNEARRNGISNHNIIYLMRHFPYIRMEGLLELMANSPSRKQMNEVKKLYPDLAEKVDYFASLKKRSQTGIISEMIGRPITEAKAKEGKLEKSKPRNKNSPSRSSRVNLTA
jgi:hypothetical protein